MNELTEQQDKTLQRGHCPFCNSTRFLHGPCGGCSANIRCVGCGKEFGLQTPFRSEVIDRNEPGLYRGEFSLKAEISDIRDGLDYMFGKPVPPIRPLGGVAFLIVVLLSSSLVTGAILYLIRHGHH